MLDDTIILNTYNPMSQQWVLKIVPFTATSGIHVLTFKISTTQTTNSDTTLMFSNINITPKYPDLTSKNGTWSYKGCYNDDTGNRAITNMISSDTTIYNCIQMAEDNNSNIIGVQYGKQCFINNDTNNKYSSYGINPDNSYCNPLNPGAYTNIVYQKN
jgi:hypothetical protein